MECVKYMSYSYKKEIFPRLELNIKTYPLPLAHLIFSIYNFRRTTFLQGEQVGKLQLQHVT